MAITQFLEPQTISIESHLERLALEANVLANTIDTFKNLLPSLAAKISDISGTFSHSEISAQSKNINACYSELKKKIDYVKFTEYDKTLVSVPEGFKGNLLDYIKLINKLSPEIYSEVNSILTEYSFLLSSFITNKDSKLSNKDSTAFFSKMQTHRESILKEISKFFPSDSALSKVYLTGIIGRFADLVPLVEETNKLDKKHVAQNIEDISKGVHKAVDLLNIVIKDIENGNVSNVSGGASLNISKGAYEVAKYVEFVSIFRFKTEQAITSVSKLVDQLNVIIK